jgi:hypothetical protein
MSRKTVSTILLGIVSFTSLAWASDCNDYIIPGRALMFNGKLSGLRQAYQTFDDGINDLDCSNNRELRFLHAVTRTVMLVIKDDNGSIDSVFELATHFGIDVLGDYWAPHFDPCGLELSIALNQHDAYQIPSDAPDINEISGVIGASMIPEINEIIDELNSISDPCENRFRIFFDPNETRIFFDPSSLGLQHDLEVDYAEVLILKGLLTALKGLLQAQAAYDMCIDANDMLVEKVYGDSFNINTDLLVPHPNLLDVLPTPCYPDANGKAILAQARQDWIDSINYYLNTIDYIRSEGDDQEDDLLYIDPNKGFLVDTVNEKLIALRDSLQNDTIMTYPLETTKTYDIYDVNSIPIGQLVLVYNFTGIEGDDGSLTFTDSNLAPSPWEVEWFGREEANCLEIELEYYSESEWGEGWFEGTLSSDSNSITNGTLEYWGSTYGTLNDLSGQLISTEVTDVNVNLNPIFGSSPNYPNAVNPRDLLPMFNWSNDAEPNTMGHGLGDDATLGGIFPDMNQQDWNEWLDLQAGEPFPVGTISGTVSYDAWNGEPIFIQAYEDWDDPENSIVASMMIAEPGFYTLEGIEPGWEGYVRAFTPLFGFKNFFELEAFEIEAAVKVSMPRNHIDDVNINLHYPRFLENGVWVSDEIYPGVGEKNWYAFNAVDGANYALDVNQVTSQYAYMTLYGRDGHTEIEQLYYWQTQHLDWTCLVSGRYYVKVANGYYQPAGGTYRIRMTSNRDCPQADIANPDWVGVKDCKVDFYDLAVLVSNWLERGPEPYWLDNGDFDKSASVDFIDFAVVADEWLQDWTP